MKMMLMQKLLENTRKTKFRWDEMRQEDNVDSAMK